MIILDQRVMNTWTNAQVSFNDVVFVWGVDGYIAQANYFFFLLFQNSSKRDEEEPGQEVSRCSRFYNP